MQEVLPELVSQDPQGMLSLKYTSLVARLVASIQALKKQNETLEKRLAEELGTAGKLIKPSSKKNPHNP